MSTSTVQTKGHLMGRALSRISPLLVATGFLLSACGGGEPFLDYYPVREANIVPMNGSRLTAAVCFSGDDPKTREIQSLAAAHCAELGRVAQYSSTAKFRCTPTTPNVAYYSCNPAPLKTVRGEATVQPGQIEVPAPAWLPDSEAPEPPTPPSGLSSGDPWDPSSVPPEPKPTPSAPKPPPVVPSWDEGETGVQGAFPTNAITTMPRL